MNRAVMGSPPVMAFILDSAHARPSSVSLAVTNNLPGWTAVVYYDANGNGVLDAGEVAVSNASFVSNGAAGLAPGESVKLLVKVFAPGDATGE